MVAKAAALLLLVSSTFAACPMGTIYDSSFNKCYKYVPQAVNFLTAEKNCEILGGTLVSVLNSFENSYISEIAAASSSSPSFWIGLNLLVASQWTWTNGNNGSFLNWAPGQPSDPSAYPCAALNEEKSNQWTKELCSSQKPYLCQVDPNYVPSSCGTTTTRATSASSPSTPPTTVKPGACPNGHCPGANFTLYSESCKCYKFHQATVPYNKALDACKKENAILPIILNDEENYFLANFTLARSYDTVNIWLYLWCTGSVPSSCKWEDGTPATYTNFGRDPWPYRGATQSPVSGLWYPAEDDFSQNYVCQQDGIP